MTCDGYKKVSQEGKKRKRILQKLILEYVWRWSKLKEYKEQYKQNMSEEDEGKSKE